MTIRFTVPGRPVPKGRPRVTRYGTYTPKATVEYERSIRESWSAQSGQSFPAGTPLFVTVSAHFEIPRSLSKKARLALRFAPHTRHHGDLDNVVKSVLDALNGHAFPDDCAVCMIHASKDYRDEPGTEVTIQCYNKEETP